MNGNRLRIGYIPLCDATALIVAADKGFIAAEGLDVELVREVSWSNVRDKLNIGLFDAAHLIAPVAIASSLGIGHVKVPINRSAAIAMPVGGHTALVLLLISASDKPNRPAATYTAVRPPITRIRRGRGATIADLRLN